MSHLIDLDVAFYMHLIRQFDSAHVKCDVYTGLKTKDDDAFNNPNKEQSIVEQVKQSHLSSIEIIHQYDPSRCINITAKQMHVCFDSGLSLNRAVHSVVNG